MNITRLRTLRGITALKGENAFTTGVADCSIRMLPCGHFIVTKYGASVLVPSAGVDYADVEPSAETVPEATRGPGRPPKVAA